MFKLQFKHQPQRSVWLVGDNFKLGASSANDLVVDGLGIDEFHAEIKIDGDLLVLKSKAGSCFVNDLPVNGEHRLLANDELRIGKLRLLVIDPKQQHQRSDQQAVTAEAVTGWSLLPVHPKLQSRDFSIAANTVVGRSSDCQFAIPYKLLSREHAQLSVVNGELVLKDLNSANGCFVNDQQVTEAKLHPGDKVSFAKLAFTVQGPAAAQQKAPAAAAQALNKTMIRPAVNLQQELQRASNTAAAESLSLSEEAADSDGDPAEMTTDTPAASKRWPLLIALLLAAAAMIWWLLPFKSF